MYGLLLEYVADERSEEEDAARRGFLSRLLRELSAHQERFGAMPHAPQITTLRDIQATVDEEFADDPVVEHLVACGDERERSGEMRSA